MSSDRQSRRFTPDDEQHLIVRSVQAAVRSGQVIDAHAHDWPQLIYASRGVMTVWTEQGSWAAPPHWAILAPAGVRHAIRFSAEGRFDTLYLQPSWSAAHTTDRCRVIAVSPLLRELILEAAARRMLDGRDTGDAALGRLILDSISFRERSPFDLPEPLSPLARAAAEALRGDAALSSAELARRLRVTSRTLERRFAAETGLSLGAWRRQAALLAGLHVLAAAGAVKAAAAAAGYRSASAFVAAFKTQFGDTPGRYFAAQPPPMK